MKNDNADKVERVLGIYTKLLNGSVVNKAEEANNYGVNERTIQRDIEDIRSYMEKTLLEDGVYNSIIYDRNKKGYRLEQIYKLKLTNSEILAIAKILLESRAFSKKEMLEMLDKLIECCVPVVNKKLVEDLIRNEAFHYIELNHKTVFIDTMWELGQAINNHQYIEIQYQGMKGSSLKTRKLKPLAIMFSEYYFYLTAFIEDEKVRENFNVINDSYPTIYRIDRIKHLKVLDERFHVPYKDRFEEGEFRKRIQFMYGGKLRKIRFKYTGYAVEAILDKVPTAKIEKEEDGVYTISAEVFGDGIDMWLRSQGENIQII